MAVKKRMEAGASRTPLAERIAQQRRTEPDISLERLEAELSEASRYDIVAALKELEKAGVGQLLKGRKGQKSRFVWGEKSAAPTKASKKAGAASAAGSAEHRAKVTSRKPAPPARRLERPKATTSGAASSGAASTGAVSRAASGVGAAAAAAPVSAARTSRTLKHSFHLRPGMQVAIDLPEDVTPTEVDRFCSFLKAIPFASRTR